jgi:hypothetical protein
MRLFIRLKTTAATQRADDVPLQKIKPFDIRLTVDTVNDPPEIWYEFLKNHPDYESGIETTPL